MRGCSGSERTGRLQIFVARFTMSNRAHAPAGKHGPAQIKPMAQLPNVAEKIMADELSTVIGWDPDQAAMVTTSGGSLASAPATRCLVP